MWSGGMRFWGRRTFSMPFRQITSSSTSTEEFSGRWSDQRGHALAIDPEDATFLIETRIQRVRRKTRRPGDDDVTIWDYLMTSYTPAYDERLLLVDREVSSKIAREIARSRSPPGDHDRGGLFIDADGGFCRVTEALQKRGDPVGFAAYHVYEKDINLLCLSQRANSNYLLLPAGRDVVNLSQFPSNFMSSRGEYVSPLYNLVTAAAAATSPSTSSNLLVKPPSPGPAFTLFGTATHNFVKYLVQRRLQRHDVNRFLTEFSLGDGRPEFFLICTPRTWLHLTSEGDDPMRGSKVWRQPRNILFQLLFESELLETLPRKSFFPWRESKFSLSSSSCVAKQYARLDDHLYLIRTRPKLRTGIEHLDMSEGDRVGGAFSHVLLEYFVHALFRHKHARLLPLMDVWHPGATLECVRQGLVGVNSLTGDLDLEGLADVFNLITRQPDLDNSSFRFMAEAFNANRFKDHPTTCEETRKNYLKLKRKIAKS